jgi:hypothetical protein
VTSLRRASRSEKRFRPAAAKINYATDAEEFHFTQATGCEICGMTTQTPARRGGFMP